MDKAVVVRLSGEIGVKGTPVRLRYERLVARYSARLLRREGFSNFKIDHRFGRIYVYAEDVNGVCKALSKLFGIHSLSPAVRVGASIDEIVSAGVEVAKKRLRDGVAFAVRCRRVGQHPFTSSDIAKALGSAILQELGDRGIRVNLDEPDVVVGVEVRDEDAFIYTETVEGVGGLPPNVQGRVVCLVSGGIDSPVAYWLAMRRGCTAQPIHLDAQPYTSPQAVEKALDALRVLRKNTFSVSKKAVVVPYGEVLSEVVDKCPQNMVCVVCKRMMLRIAEAIALREGAWAVVTGDILGEQASQTLQNLFAIDSAATKLPVLRPLIGFDKSEVEELARKIGTYEVSAREEPPCRAAPKRPRTKASPEEALEAEKDLDVEGLVREAVEQATCVSLD